MTAAAEIQAGAPDPSTGGQVPARNLVIPSSANTISESIAELEQAGGTAQRDFRLTYVGANVALEVTEELYGRWQATKRSESDTSTAAGPDLFTPETAGRDGRGGAGRVPDSEPPGDKRTGPAKGKGR